MSGPLLDLSLTSAFVDGSGKMVTSNRGSLLGTCQCGDGVTPATFPSLLVGGRRGMSFNTGDTQYLRHATFPALGNQGTLYALVYLSPLTISQAATHVVIEQAATPAGYASGCMLDQEGALYFLYWGGGARVINAGAVLTPGIHCLVGTNDGSLCRLYLDGVLVGTPAAAPGPSTATGLYIGGDSAFSSLHNSNVFAARVFPYALTPTQIRALGDRDRAMLNLF